MIDKNLGIHRTKQFMAKPFKYNCLWIIFLLSSFACQTDHNSVDELDGATNDVKSSLQQHTVLSDGHLMNVWEKKAENTKGAILFIHGRTWSSLPNFDLQVADEELSLMDGMVAQGYTAYALDLRGYGATPRDSTEWLSPNKAASDILNVLNWISSQNQGIKVHLFGYSMGSTSSLLAAQKSPEDIASLTVFGYWQDLDTQIPENPDEQLQKIVNTAEAAASDFITPGSISQVAIDAYVKSALADDPIKVDWRYVHQFNDINPSSISTPVLVLQGALDPIAPTDRQAKLFTRLKTFDKSWVVISGGDHAAFLEASRKDLIHSLTAFIDRFNEY
ncbi:MAG: alpha/beta fold hydrolase [Cytophagales bacterium]|nr:alpha/beta fold hydrolase [Cytophagales bacterium]